MTDRPVPAHTLKQRREQTIELLCQHFARDNLEMAEFESRLDVANRAVTTAELDALLGDLPAAATDAPLARPAPAPPAAAERQRQVPAQPVEANRTMLALLAGVERRGRWVPARRNWVVAVMGGADLDFRDVDLPPGETEVTVFCMMGGVDIIVPPGLAVDADGTAILGAFGHASAPPVADPDSPLLRIRGICVMGAAEIAVRRPGESGKDARRRERDERRQLRERNRRRGAGE
jgi:hypothetical protein